MKLLFLTLITFLSMTIQAQDITPSNKHFWFTHTTSAAPSTIWSIWTDVENWKNWDTGLKDANLPGTFELGVSGHIISLEGKRAKFRIIAYEEGKSYTYKTKLPLGSLYIKRYLEFTEKETTFTHEVWFAGLTKGLFARAFGGKFREMLPDVLNNIKQIAESK